MEALNDESFRRCGSCKAEKKLTEFGLNRKRKHGRQHRCRSCMREHDRARRADPVKREHERKSALLARSKPERKAKAAATHKIYYDKHADAYQARARERHHRCWSERLIYSARTASRQRTARGRYCPVSVTKEHLESLWVKQGGFCFFSGVPMSKARDRLDTVSIDRLDSSKGYEPGNVVLALKAMNFAKTGHSESEFRDLLDRVADAIVASRKLKSVA